MAYKQDINLFKAAGGGSAKAKKMPITKKLLIVMVVVTVVCGALIGVLIYMQKQMKTELKTLTDQSEAYNLTETSTKGALEQYGDVLKESKSIEVIEYYNEARSGVFSCLSSDEISALKTYIDSNQTFTTQYSFSEICQGILNKLAVMQYELDQNDEESFILLNNINYIYSAVTNMVANYSLYAVLPSQNENDIWYSYYRGQVIMVLQNVGTVSASDFSAMLRDSDTVGCDPFMHLVRNDSVTQDDNFNINCNITVTLDEIDYSVFCLTRKTNIDRLLDIIDDRIVTEEASDISDELVDYYFSIHEIHLTAKDISFEITFFQTRLFGLEEICQAINESDFFKAEKTLAFPTSDSAGEIKAELSFTITNSAYTLMEDEAKSRFIVDVTQ